MRDSDLTELRNLDLFHAMSNEHFDALMRAAYVQTFPPGVDLIAEGDPCDFLHIVLEGSVELFASWNGRETTMATVRPVSTFILAATIRDAPYLMSARTGEKCRLVLLPSSDVRSVFAKDAAFARAVVSELALCYRSVVKHTKDIKLRSSIERLANYLLRHSRHAGALEFDLNNEKRKIASYLGMTPENMSRAIKALQPYGVAIDAQKVSITSLKDLERFAKPTALIDDPFS
jgi:CRP/FNR family transcriptional activator FtrB